MKRVPSFGRGLALIEALVALTVTSIGLVSVLGVQVVLRQNADLAKQRSEAVRLAQEDIEKWRSFATVASPAPAGSVSYAELATGANAPETGSNTSFTVSRVVTETAAPAYKTLAVTATWRDRNNVDQAVQLNTTIAGVAPELAATVVVPADGSPVARAGGRAFGIPREAKRLSVTESGFIPPQGSPRGSVWKINNTTGIITFCQTTAVRIETLSLDNISNCLPGRAQLLSGYVRFALPVLEGGVPRAPTATDAEWPVSPPPPSPTAVRLLRTEPSALEVDCFIATRATYLSYYCAIPVATESAQLPRWSGRSVVTGLPDLTDDTNNASATGHRVCRYTRYDHDRSVGTSPDPLTNQDHPLNYLNVGGPLANQNFLVIRAGNGSTAFACPKSDPNVVPRIITRAHPLDGTEPP
jgi:Tfp pilus assembly protein PilV